MEGAPGPRVMLGTKGPQDRQVQPRQSTRVMRDPHHGLRPCRYLGALASPWMGMEGGRLRRGAAACPEKAPRCWSRSVHIREPPWGTQTRLMQEWGSGCSWCGAAQGVGRQSPPGCGITAGPALIWLFHVRGPGFSGEWPGMGSRDGDTLYTGNTCVMHDTRLALQAGAAPGLRGHGANAMLTHTELPLHTDTSTMLGGLWGPQDCPGWGTWSIPVKGPVPGHQGRSLL